MSVCKVDSINMASTDGRPPQGSINDLRMGTVDKTLLCETCKCNFSDCPGHFGHIELAKPMFHVGFIEVCRKILRCVCYNCSRLLIDKDIKFRDIMKVKNNKKRQNLIFNLCKGIKECRKKQQPKDQVII